MKVIGLSGGSGSGKGYVAALFESRGAKAIDTDAIYRELTSSPGECMSELIAAFGEKIATSTGALDRTVMRGLVFSSEGADYNRARLNEISHKHVLRKVRSMLVEFRESDVPAVLVDAPLLFESGFHKECDAVICVVAPVDVRINRIMKRDGISKEAAVARISTQLSDEILIARSDYVIDNGGDSATLCSDVDRIYNSILKK